MSVMFALQREEKFPPISKVAVAGRQTIFSSIEDIGKYLERYGIFDDCLLEQLRACTPDTDTRKSVGNISDIDFFKILFSLKLVSLDSSGYESADQVLDLNEPFTPETASSLLEKCKLVFDGGSLDNVFDPATALKNLASLLAANGRIVNWVCASAWPGSYAMVSPEWLYSFYAVNGFREIRVWLVVPQNDLSSWPNPTARFFRYSPYFTPRLDWDPLEAVKTNSGHPAFVIASAKASYHKLPHEWENPMQSHYLTDADEDWRIRQHPDRELKIEFDLESHEDGVPSRPFNSDHFQYSGLIRGPRPAHTLIDD